MPTTRYRQILRSLLATILQSGLSVADLHSLADELRRGQLPDELAFMLDQVLFHLGEPTSASVTSELKSLERLVKEKRLSKSSLGSVMTSISAGSTTVDSSGSVRQMLQEFLSFATSAQIEKLREILLSPGRLDPFLKGISETRK
jgi:hypothetical protein